MLSRPPLTPDIEVKADPVHETVYTAKVSGYELDDLIAAAVMSQIDPVVKDAPSLKWKVVHRSETTATEGTRQIAEVTIAVDHRAEARAADPKSDDA